MSADVEGHALRPAISTRSREATITTAQARALRTIFASAGRCLALGGKAPFPWGTQPMPLRDFRRSGRRRPACGGRRVPAESLRFCGMRTPTSTSCHGIYFGKSAAAEQNRGQMGSHAERNGTDTPISRAPGYSPRLSGRPSPQHWRGFWQPYVLSPSRFSQPPSPWLRRC